MSDTNEFGDQAQIELIKKRLWIKQDIGRAAVMVGSGFSRNAEPRSPSAEPFPLWSGITNEMLDALYPHERTSREERSWRELHYASAAGAMRLAGEYSALFGREQLDDLLLRVIPDDMYSPAYLHRLLLSLPWSDVFTTNYDTLLERSSLNIYERAYGIVAAPEDIPSKQRPRIVKLHGSFPHQRPFVITEEDFRSYGERSAPFVNLVQQSAQENVLVLLGFSGEDPNFLSWTGWVRDNLGEHAPKVYLCQLLELSASERKLLEDRNVVPIDLSPRFPVEKWPNRDERHQKSIEWFLLNLMSGKPPNPVSWLPTVKQASRWVPSSGVPEPPEVRSFTLKELTPLMPTLSKESDEDPIMDRVETWAKQRKEYPGWLVAPREKRELIVREILGSDYWVDRILRVACSVTPERGIRILYELNWQLECALVPLFTNWVESMTSVLESIDPYPELISLPDPKVTPEQSGHRSLNWGEIAEQWVELAFAVARTAREDQHESTFRLWMDRISSVADRRNEWKARWFYEECQYWLFKGNINELRSRLAAWPENLGGPTWSLKRAALRAELGDVRDAARLTVSSLDTIREQMQSDSSDLALMSLEGWAITLLRIIQSNISIEQQRQEDFQERLRVLEPLKCNPMTELHEASLILNRPIPDEKVSGRTQTTRGFDPGRSTTTTKFESGFPVEPFLPGFGMARMLEEGAVPPRGGNTVVERDAVLNAALWIKPYAPMWSLSLLLRSTKLTSGSELEEWFSRTLVATLSTDQTENLYKTFTEALVQAISYLDANNHELREGATGFAERQVRLLSAVLSRVSIRLNHEQRSQLLDVAVQMYEMPLFRQFHELHDSVGVMLERLLSQAMNPREVLDHMERLLATPVAQEPGFEVEESSTWPDPLNVLTFRGFEDITDLQFDRGSWTPHIQRLMSVARTGSAEARYRAICRLGTLFDLQVLFPNEINDFGKALWFKLHESTGLPKVRGLQIHRLLDLPHPPGAAPEDSVKAILLSREFESVLQNGGIRLDRSDQLARDLRGGPVLLAGMPEEQACKRRIDWTVEEALYILEKMRSTWTREKEVLSNQLGTKFGSPGKELAGRFEDWVRLLAEEILPRVAYGGGNARNAARSFVEDLESHGVTILYAAPATVELAPDAVDTAADKLWGGLVSTDPEIAREAVRGTALWHTLNARDIRIMPAPAHLLEEVLNNLVACRIPGLRASLANLSNLLDFHPEQLQMKHLETLCLALRYLLENTQVQEVNTEETLKAPTSPIPLYDRPDYRALSARLASNCAYRYKMLGKTLPEILERWRVISQEETLPEVRRAWQ